MNQGWALLSVPLLIGLNAFFVAAEYAVVALRPTQIENLRRRGRVRAARAMEQLKADPAGAIGAIQVCITMTNLLLGWIGEPAMSWLLHLLFRPMTPAATSASATLLRQLQDVFDRAIAAQRAGNWAQYGEEMNRLGELIRRLTRGP